MNQQDMHAQEIAKGERFGFGENWTRFLKVLDHQRVDMARASLTNMLDTQTLDGKTFLDVGSGSGLFSLAARELGATVYSFDYDPKSVNCTNELKHRFYKEDTNWTIEHGSALDQAYVASLCQFDVVYSWGVLHHTGQMWQALKNVAAAVKPEGMLFIAIYNDQGWISRYWTKVKHLYTRHKCARPLLIAAHAPYLIGAPYVVRRLTRRLSPARGMTLWFDMLDWLGGYPFEVAKPEDIILFFRKHGFELTNLKTCGGRQGCNEFVFKKLTDPLRL